MRKLTIIVLSLVCLIIAAMIWQHFRYLDIRRDIVQDRQPMLYGSDTFHAVTFFKLSRGANIIESLSRFVNQIESKGAGKIIYAGQAAIAHKSDQIGEVDWDAVIMVQYPSRQKYDENAETPEYQANLSGFSKTYTHGMHRPAAANLMIHQAFLLLSLIDILKGNWGVDALEPLPAPEPADRAAIGEFVNSLLNMRSINGEALVIFNLQRRGTPEQQAENRSYAFKMITRMARLSHGPMHIGPAIVLEGDAEFEMVAVVYYPGVTYFASLVQSRFFQAIIGNKQLGDYQAVLTVPILDMLTGGSR